MVRAMPVEDRRDTFTIRQLCREFGVTARALRFYEDKGLLAPDRRGQSRIFSSRDRARLKLILRGKRVGFSLSEIREMLDLYDRKDGGAVQMAVSLPRYRAQLETLKRQRADLDAAIETLVDGCEWMERRLAEFRPDLLPQASDYESVLRARLDHDHDEPLPRASSRI
jgi:DNA-binding transcriptional MerR regulator